MFKASWKPIYYAIPAVGVSVLWSAVSMAALDIPDAPLFLTSTGVEPNITLTIDDSGSMRRAYVPEICGDDSDCAILDNRYAKSAHYNALYYDPNVVYDPPKNADGTTRTTSFTNAWRNGFFTSGTVGTVNFGTTVDLTTGYRPTASLDMAPISPNPVEQFMNREHHDSGNITGSTGSPAASYAITDYQNADGSASGSAPGQNLLSVIVNGVVQSYAGTTNASCGTRPGADNQYRTYITGSTLRLCFRNSGTMPNKPITVIHQRSDAGPAYYNVFDGTNAGCTGDASQKKLNNNCYDIKFVTSASGAGGADERQNFANWYSFYRTRNLATGSGASLAFANVDETARVAWQALRTCPLVDTDCDGWRINFTGKRNAINNFSDTHKNNFYDWLFQIPTSGGTPLREAMIRVGEYYTTTGEQSPYDNDFTSVNSGEHSCRKNFHILMTDGIWNDSLTNIGNVDDTAIAVLPEPDTDRAYAPGAPYRDGYSHTLSDVAFKYWSTDLRGTLDNNVPAHIVDQSGDETAQYWNAKNDPASWQHMVNYTMGVGLTAFLADAGLTWSGDTYSGSYVGILAGTPWPEAVDQNASDADYGTSTSDLWHAAINSRGEFYSVESADQIVTTFADILSTIDTIASSGGGAGLSSNTTQIDQVGAVIFEAKFNADWSGRLLARPVQADFSLGDEYWDAGKRIPPPHARKIFTTNAGAEAFTTCSGPLEDALDRNSAGEVDGLCSKRINWLRGDAKVTNATSTGYDVGTGRVTATYTATGHGFVPGDSVTISGIDVTETPTPTKGYNGTFEVTAASANTFTASIPSAATGPGTYDSGGRVHYSQFRNRQISVLGDIMNSDPFYAYLDDFGFGGGASAVAGKDDYATFVTGKGNRPPVIYAGANDGMLHGFQADIGGTNSGVELLAYVPHGVYENLSALTHPEYSHKYYVDGQLSVSDAYIGSTWATYLAGSLGAGGKTVFALDVSDPVGFAVDDVKWEFADAGDLGLTYSKPQIVPNTANQWAVIFGNGYNSTNDNAYLYVVNLANGSQIDKVAAEPDGSNGNNGLSTAYLYDSNGDRIVDAAYAGDLQGNLWKFVNTNGHWSVGNGNAPLFTARNDNNDVQPITSQPKVAIHPQGGVLVYFGTGSYLATTDLTNDDQQAFYAIWDKPGATGTVPRSDLEDYSILQETTAQGFTVRTTSVGTVNWVTQRGWYLELPDTPDAPSERIISTPLVLEFTDPTVPDRVLFVTTTPEEDPCSRGGITWLMELDLITGGRTATSVFDLSGNQSFGDEDTVGGVPVSGVQLPSTYGITGEPLLLKTESGNIVKEFSGSTGESGTAGGPLQQGELAAASPNAPPDRIYWRQIR